jgi:alkylation response protein AidB-like acyl-CoA dehydrogenase
VTYEGADNSLSVRLARAAAPSGASVSVVATLQPVIQVQGGDAATVVLPAEVLTTLDPTRSAAKLSFAGAPAERLGDEDGIEAMQAVFDRAAVLLAFEQVGGSDKCLEMAKAYALERHAFGRAIAGYQAIKHKLADIYVKNEIARSNAYYGAWALNTDAGELPLAAATARVAASEAFWVAAKENIQTHGGIGFTWEADPQLYYRRSRQLSLVAGAPATWRERLVSQLEMKNAA